MLYYAKMFDEVFILNGTEEEILSIWTPLLTVEELELSKEEVGEVLQRMQRGERELPATYRVLNKKHPGMMTGNYYSLPFEMSVRVILDKSKNKPDVNSIWWKPLEDAARFIDRISNIEIE